MLCILYLPPRVAAHGPVIQSAESLRKWGYLGSIPSGATTAGARLPIAS